MRNGILLVLGACGFLFGVVCAAPVKMVALHPILGDMARQIGGDDVNVVDLVRPQSNLHSFDPTPQDVARGAGAQFVLASGKQMEPYLPKLKDSMGGGCHVVVLGDSIPDVFLGGAGEYEHGAECEHGHEGCNHGPNDPHWWHSPENMKRAARAFIRATAVAYPDGRIPVEQMARYQAWCKRMDELVAWAHEKLAFIEESRRILVTGHAAMGHFCRDFDFKEIALLGVSREDDGTPARLANMVAALRKNTPPAVFPESSASPKGLAQIAKSLSIPLGRPLVTDGLSAEAHTFESVFRHNVESIAEACSSAAIQQPVEQSK